MSRPDGTNQIYGGWIAFGLAIVFFVIGLNVEVSSYNPGSSGERVLLIVVSACVAGLGFWLLTAGWIIRAIWYLPSKHDAVLVTDKPTLELTERGA